MSRLTDQSRLDDFAEGFCGWAFDRDAVKPSPEGEASVDRLFAVMKPHFEAAIRRAVDAGVLRRVDADAREAQDRRMLKLPRHIQLTIEHNPHRSNYQTAAQWLEEYSGQIVDRDAILEFGEIWEITWHPDTPVGSCSVAASTLERALDLANAAET